MIDSIWQYHLSLGGNTQGFYVGLFFVLLMGVIIYRLVVPRKTSEISDEDFYKIVLSEEEEK